MDANIIKAVVDKQNGDHYTEINIDSFATNFLSHRTPGGINPVAAGRAVVGAARSLGASGVKVATVVGDDVRSRASELGLPDDALFASAYLGARPIVEALPTILSAKSGQSPLRQSSAAVVRTEPPGRGFRRDLCGVADAPLELAQALCPMARAEETAICRRADG